MVVVPPGQVHQEVARAPDTGPDFAAGGQPPPPLPHGHPPQIRVERALRRVRDPACPGGLVHVAHQVLQRIVVTRFCIALLRAVSQPRLRAGAGLHNINMVVGTLLPSLRGHHPGGPQHPTDELGVHECVAEIITQLRFCVCHIV